MGTYKNVPKWHRDLARVCDSIPICLCGNKADVKKRQIETKKVTFHRKKNLKYHEISAKSNFNFEKPFLYLARKLIEEVPLYPPEIEISPADKDKLNQDLLEAPLMP